MCSAPSMSRRSFLSGRAAMPPAQPRPPWALEARQFIERCTRCDACLSHCPTRLLIRGDGGYPTLDFTAGHCSFCGECVRQCAPHALVRTAPEAPAWTLRARIAPHCLPERGVECRVCGESCPTGAIRFRPRAGGPARPGLDPARCTGCGACLAPCPVRAIDIAPSQPQEINP